jgi:hypothetical protein
MMGAGGVEEDPSASRVGVGSTGRSTRGAGCDVEGLSSPLFLREGRTVRSYQGTFALPPFDGVPRSPVPRSIGLLRAGRVTTPVSFGAMLPEFAPLLPRPPLLSSAPVRPRRGSRPLKRRERRSSVSSGTPGVREPAPVRRSCNAGVDSDVLGGRAAMMRGVRRSLSAALLV